MICDFQECFIHSILEELLETLQSFPSASEEIHVFAECESGPALAQVAMLVPIELANRDGRNSDFMSDEPARFEVASSSVDGLWEGIVIGHFEIRNVDKQEVRALWVSELYPQFRERVNKDVPTFLVFEPLRLEEIVGPDFLETDCYGLLHRGV